MRVRLRFGQGTFGRLPRKVTSVTVGAAAFVAGLLFLIPSGCADVGGMSSWDRCWTVVGGPAFSVEDWGLNGTLDILVPLAVGLLSGLIAWWLLGRRNSERT